MLKKFDASVALFCVLVSSSAYAFWVSATNETGEQGLFEVVALELEHELEDECLPSSLNIGVAAGATALSLVLMPWVGLFGQASLGTQAACRTEMVAEV